jgi:thioredoxin reductase
MSGHYLPIAIIGAGPVGLAAAAHVLARGDIPIVFEAGAAVGHTVRQWSHVRMFSPWEFNVDRKAAGLLIRSGWQHPPKDEIPTGGELVAQYLEPLASLPELRQRIHLRCRVVGITRKGLDKVKTTSRADQPFVLRVKDADGREQTYEAKAVIDASGTWSSPNPAGADGLPALNELAAADRIASGIPDVLGAHRGRYAGRTTMVVGSGHSALNALIDLAKLKQSVPESRIIWAIRKQNIEAAFGGEAADALPARGALGTQARTLVETGMIEVLQPFRVERIDSERDTALAVSGDHAGTTNRIGVEQMIVATGFRPDFSFLREIRLSIDPWLESSGTIGPLIDPNLHSCGSVRPHGARELAHAEHHFFIAGMKSYGRAPTFLLATGYEQVRSIVAELAGDHAAALDVQLVLPETGVCNTRPVVPKSVAASCCGGPAQSSLDSCCVEDEAAKAIGSAGCGCEVSQTPAKSATRAKARVSAAAE